MQSKLGQGGAKCRKNTLQKLTCGGCKIYNFVVRKKKLGKFYPTHRHASFCRPPGEPSPPSGHLKDCHFRLISADRVPTSVTGNDASLPSPWPCLLRLHQCQWPPSAPTAPRASGLLGFPQLCPSGSLGVQCSRQPHNFSLLPPHSKVPFALAGSLSCVECHPLHQKVAGLIPGQGTYLGCGFNPQSGCVWEATN